MKVTDLDIPGVKLIGSSVHGDARGHFSEILSPFAGMARTTPRGIGEGGTHHLAGRGVAIGFDLPIAIRDIGLDPGLPEGICHVRDRDRRLPCRAS